MAAPGDVASEVALLATRIADAVGFSFADATDEQLTSDGAWEYHFESDNRWGFVAAGPEGMVETTYPGWQTLVIESDHWAVFHGGTLVGNVSLHGGQIKWYASPTRDEHPAGSELPSAMREAFRAELDAVAPSVRLFVDPKGRSNAQSGLTLAAEHASKSHLMSDKNHGTIPASESAGRQFASGRTATGKTTRIGRSLRERFSGDATLSGLIDPKAGGESR